MLQNKEVIFLKNQMCENKYRCVVIDKQFQNCFIEIKMFDWLIIENKTESLLCSCISSIAP